MLSVSQIRCFQSAEDEDLWPLWQALEADAHFTSFQSIWFMRPFMRDYCRKLNATPCIVMVFERANPVPVMILPFVRYSRHGQTTIALADLELCDYAAPVLSKSIDWDKIDMDELWDQIREAMPARDLITFKKMPLRVGEVNNPLARLRGTELMGVSTSILKAGPVSHGEHQDEPCPQMQVRDLERKLAEIGPDDSRTLKKLQKKLRVAKARLKKQEQDGKQPEVSQGWNNALPLPEKVVKDVQARIRRMGRAGDYEETIHTKTEDLHTLLDAAIELRSERCRELNIENILEEEAVEAFYRSLIERSLPHARMVGISMTLDNQPIAISLGILVNGVFNGLILAIGGAETRKFAPGISVVTRQMQWAFSAGCSIVDMGVGGSAYKERFQGEKMQLLEYERACSAIGWAGAPFLKARRKLRVGLQATPRLNSHIRRMVGKV